MMSVIRRGCPCRSRIARRLCTSEEREMPRSRMSVVGAGRTSSRARGAPPARAVRTARARRRAARLTSRGSVVSSRRWATRAPQSSA
eukprot:5486982-Alexandrium_andersonii.AAC.1